MILTCPECSTSYMAKDEAIGPNGRTVRCAKCAATWFAPAPDTIMATPDALQLDDMQAETEGAKAEIGPETDQTPLPFGTAATEKNTEKSADVIMRDKVDAEKRQRRQRTIWLIWLIPLLLISAAFIAIYFGRNAIVKQFPGTVPFYNALGIQVSSNGLQIEPPTVRTVMVNGETTIVINGAVKNLSNETKDLPMLILSMHNPAGDSVVEWQMEFEKPKLRGQERLEFASEYPNPPPDSVSLRYKLAE